MGSDNLNHTIHLYISLYVYTTDQFDILADHELAPPFLLYIKEITFVYDVFL